MRRVRKTKNIWEIQNVATEDVIEGPIENRDGGGETFTEDRRYPMREGHRPRDW